MNEKIRKLLKSRNFIAFVLIFVMVGIGFYFRQKLISGVKKPVYTETYRLVPEKISQSAAIRVNLPPNISPSSAKNNIKFSPQIEGFWVAEKQAKPLALSRFFAFAAANKESAVFFKPKEKLTLNRHYGVELALTGEGSIESDFLAVEDPKIVAIFPKEGSETPENSEITIVFNRPMVPLTTLSELEEKDVPVEIIPKTEGKFRWITTRNLQFIPKERLQRSSHYKVVIKDGLTSMDGLAVKGEQMEFITRKLRYLNFTQAQTPYNNPISIYFNQPVDLEKTKKEIFLIDVNTGKEIPFIAEYERKTKEEKEKEETKTEPLGIFDQVNNLLAGIFPSWISLPGAGDDSGEFNQSVIQIYNEKDKFGRKKLWDFENNYSLGIMKAYPLEGDIILDESRNTNISVPNPIKEIRAESERTNAAAPDFFDPQGKLIVSFYEEINLEKTKITAPHLKEIVFGEKCKDENFYPQSDCEKIQAKDMIYITFNLQEIGLGEKIDLSFEKIVNLQGLTINPNPIKKEIVSFPEFKVLSTSPGNNSTGASLTQFIVCSTTPISVPKKEEYKNHLKANLDYEIDSWGDSWRVSVSYGPQSQRCKLGEFETFIYYGIMPLSDYSIELVLDDIFGQKLNYTTKFTSGPLKDSFLNFYHFQGSYNVTSPQKTKLTYATQNMEYVDLEICKLGPLNFLSLLEKPPQWYESTPSFSCQNTVRDTIQLPKKYWIKNYFKVDLKTYFEQPLGHYILTFSHPNYTGYFWENGKETYKKVYERTYLSITNLAVAEKRIEPQTASYGGQEVLNPQKLSELSNLYWVTNLSNLEPVTGAKVSLYKGENLIFTGSYLTNEQGIAQTPAVLDFKAAVIEKDGDTTIIPSQESKLAWADFAFLAKRIYLYTDKPIYRPSQEVFIKGIHRIGYDGNYEIDQSKKINLKVYNSKNDEIFSQDFQLNEFGTFNTKLVLDGTSPLGMYRACVQDYDCTFFDVQEYVPAAFEVKVKTDKEEYISKDTVNLDIDANYYFGVPLEGGEVEYTISSQNYYFDRFADGFDFGFAWDWWSAYEYGEKFISRGKTSISESGKAKISQALDLEKLFKDEQDRKSKIIVFDITVKNPQGQTVSAQSSFILHAGEFYFGLKPDKSFLGKDEKTNLKIKSVDTQGKAVKVEKAILNLYKVDWIYSKRQEAGGGYGYTWEKKRTLVNKFDFNTDKEGNYQKELSFSQEGEYELEARAKDKRGNLVFSTYTLYVFGEGAVNVRPTEGTELELTSEKRDLKVGEEGKIIIKSPYPKAKALISIERGKIFDYQIKEIQGNLSDFVFVAKEEYLPNVFVSVLLQAFEPEIKFGQVEFKIDTSKKELNIEVNSNKKEYLPGEEVALDILAKDWEGKPVSAELSLAVVDLSVLALEGNPKKDPLVFFYSGFPLTVQTSSNIKNILVEVEIPKTKGGSGGSEEALAKKARGTFKETAFWQAVVRTDSAGKAQVKFTLPDNLTTWQAETIGLTQDTKLGINYQEFLTKKELMVVPLKPRFIIPGDTFYVGAKIFNQSKESQTINIKFESKTLALKEKSAEKKIKLAPDKTNTVYFKVQAPNQIETGSHEFVFSAKSAKLEDTVIQEINIVRNDTYETTATANYTADKISKEYVFLPGNVTQDKGGLSVKSSATLAVFVSDALNYLLQYPYGCSEQISSRLNAIAIVKRGLNLPNLGDKFKLEKIKYKDKEYTPEELVEIGLAELYNNQKWDGGFAFWRDGESNFYATLEVINTLNNLSLAGFKINKDSLNRAADYLYTKITTDSNLYEDKNNVILAAYTLSELPGFAKYNNLKEKIIQIANNDLFVKEQISNTSLSFLAILMTKDSGFSSVLKKKISDILDNRINIDSRGAFLEPNQNFMWYYYETPVKDTALYLKSQVAQKSQNPVLDKVLRWLLNSREKDGAWGSTNNTITVIDALTDFLEWKRETESDFTLSLAVNDKSQGNFRFNAQTILDQFKKDIPMGDLKSNEINTVFLSKTDNNAFENSLYYDMALKYYLPAEQIPPRDEGFSITRAFFAPDDKENKKPILQAKVGDVLKAHLQITVPDSRNFVAIEDYIPAGMEIVNLELATEQKSLLLQEKEIEGREFIPDFKELHDDRALLFKENLSPGVYEFDYYVRALISGKFTHLPAQVSEMYFPENFGRTAGGYFEIK